MARADLLVDLVRAGSEGNQPLFRNTVEAVIAEERSRQHHAVADRLAEYLKNGSGQRNGVTGKGSNDADGLLLEIPPRRTLKDLVLANDTADACRELVEEHHRADLLRSHGLEPRHRILLSGPPGNGKTSLAEAIAGELMVSLLAVRYEALIASYLGETALRLARLFDVVRTRRCVLFFDEFDTVGKERGDEHETGEVKRVVSSLLLQVDALPSYVVVVAATNHAELLDRAVWRRFQLRLALPAPDRREAATWFRLFERRSGFKFGVPATRLAERLGGLSYAELEDFCNDVRRRYVLGLPDADARKIVMSRLRQWASRVRPKRERPRKE